MNIQAVLFVSYGNALVKAWDIRKTLSCVGQITAARKGEWDTLLNACFPMITSMAREVAQWQARVLAIAAGQ
jgi:hypothetical protein